MWARKNHENLPYRMKIKKYYRWWAKSDVTAGRPRADLSTISVLYTSIMKFTSRQPQHLSVYWENLSTKVMAILKLELSICLPRSLVCFIVRRHSVNFSHCDGTPRLCFNFGCCLSISFLLHFTCYACGSEPIYVLPSTNKSCQKVMLLLLF